MVRETIMENKNGFIKSIIDFNDGENFIIFVDENVPDKVRKDLEKRFDAHDINVLVCNEMGGSTANPLNVNPLSTQFDPRFL